MSFCAVLAVARAGLLAPAPVAYAAAPTHYAAAPVAHYAAAPVAHYAAPVAGKDLTKNLYTISLTIRFLT